MVKHWILFLAVFILCRFLCGTVLQWQGWLLLLSILSLPALSLLLSLPAMRTLQAAPDVPEEISSGDSFSLLLRTSCRWPSPPVRCCFKLQELTGGAELFLRPEKNWKPECCGIWHIQLHRCRIYDYCGLFRLPVKKCGEATVYVLPVPVPTEPLRQAWPCQECAAAGGHSGEYYDLRQYRPGDNLNRIHWKLSSKTGNLICREPLVPVKRMPVIQLQLSGSRKTLDCALGQLLWLSEKLLSRQIPHRLQCNTGSNFYNYTIFSQEVLRQALRVLLGVPVTPENSSQTVPILLIGGEPDETI